MVQQSVKVGASLRRAIEDLHKVRHSLDNDQSEELSRLLQFAETVIAKEDDDETAIGWLELLSEAFSLKK